MYRWWTISAWHDPCMAGVKLGPVTLFCYQVDTGIWVYGVAVLNKWVWERPHWWLR